VTGWVRPAAVAGYFYPADPLALRRSVATYLAHADAPDPEAATPKAIIAPHAGYRYSAPIAATAYAALASARGAVQRVVLAGPAHRALVDGVAVSTAHAFAMPLGPVEVDAEARDQALARPGVEVDDNAHAPEHSLEVHLPFLHEALGEVKVLPLLAGRAEVLADVLDTLWDGTTTSIVVSTDLSHFLDDRSAKAIDRRTAAAIVERRSDDIRPEHACGATAVRGLLMAADRHGLGVRLLDLRTSADTAGEPSRVVGYGAFALA